MKKDNFLPALRFMLSCVLFLTLLGCIKPNIQLPEPLPPLIKEYKHVTLFGNSPGMKNTGVHLEPGAMTIRAR